MAENTQNPLVAESGEPADPATQMSNEDVDKMMESILTLDDKKAKRGSRGTNVYSKSPRPVSTVMASVDECDSNSPGANSAASPSPSSPELRDESGAAGTFGQTKHRKATRSAVQEDIVTLCFKVQSQASVCVSACTALSSMHAGPEVEEKKASVAEAGEVLRKICQTLINAADMHQATLDHDGSSKVIYDCISQLQSALDKMLELTGECKFTSESNYETLKNSGEDTKAIVEKLNFALAAAIETAKQKKKKESEAPEVRHTGSLHINIRDGKELATMKDDGTLPDVMCMLEVDGRLEARTTTKVQEKSPMWAEEFVIERENFTNGQIYVWDVGHKAAKYDYVIGVAKFDQATLADGLLHESWMPLKAAARQEGSPGGNVMLELKVVFPSGSAKGSLNVKVVEVQRFLTFREGSTVAVTVEYNGVKSKTAAKKKGATIQFVEMFSFDLLAKDLDDGKESFDVSLLEDDKFVGSQSVEFGDLEEYKPHDRVVNICPRPPSDNLGSLRTKIKYELQTILPLKFYSGFIDMLARPDNYYVNLVAKQTTLLDDFARHLVRFAYAHGTIEATATSLCTQEIQATPNVGVIFRANSITSKTLDHVLKLLAMGYLKDVIGPIVTQVLESSLEFEVDPTRLDEKKQEETLKNNWTNLIELVTKFANAIFSSAAKVPPLVCRIFAHLQQQVIQKFPDDQNTVRYTVVSAFMFLRLFCAAILGPKLFGLCDMLPTEKQSRTFTLVSKTIQNLSNLAEFGPKEPFMYPMNTFILANLDKMKAFLDSVSVNRPDDGQAKVDIDIGVELAMLEWHFVHVGDKIKALPDSDKDPLIATYTEVLADIDKWREIGNAAEAEKIKSAPVATAKQDDKALKEMIERKLRKITRFLSVGAVFLKVGKSGKPHDAQISIAFDPPLQHLESNRGMKGRISWSHPGKEKDKKERDLGIEEVTAVNIGHTTDVFRKKGKGIDPACSFSLVTNDRTLDLVAPDVKTAQQWVEVINALLSGTAWKV